MYLRGALVDEHVAVGDKLDTILYPSIYLLISISIYKCIYVFIYEYIYSYVH